MYYLGYHVHYFSFAFPSHSNCVWYSILFLQILLLTSFLICCYIFFDTDRHWQLNKKKMNILIGWSSFLLLTFGLFRVFLNSTVASLYILYLYGWWFQLIVETFLWPFEIFKLNWIFEWNMDGGKSFELNSCEVQSCQLNWLILYDFLIQFYCLLPFVVFQWCVMTFFPSGFFIWKWNVISKRTNERTNN